MLGVVEDNVEKVLLVDEVYVDVFSSVVELVSLEVVVGTDVVVLDCGVVVQLTKVVVVGVVLLGIDV
jgi:hypothetical protein